jgi:hypothetical protein
LLGIAAPLLRRYGKFASGALAVGAAALVIQAGGGVLRPDFREGLAAVEANRREYLFVLACEIPVLAFALVSSGRPKKLFWLGWGIHAAFSACVLTVVIWLKFFWHW